MGSKATPQVRKKRFEILSLGCVPRPGAREGIGPGKGRAASKIVQVTLMGFAVGLHSHRRLRTTPSIPMSHLPLHVWLHEGRTCMQRCPLVPGHMERKMQVCVFCTKSLRRHRICYCCCRFVKVRVVASWTPHASRERLGLVRQSISKPTPVHVLLTQKCVRIDAPFCSPEACPSILHGALARPRKGSRSFHVRE